MSSSNEGISRGRSGSPSSVSTSRRDGQGANAVRRRLSGEASRRASRGASKGTNSGVSSGVNRRTDRGVSRGARRGASKGVCRWASKGGCGWVCWWTSRRAPKNLFGSRGG